MLLYSTILLGSPSTGNKGPALSGVSLDFSIFRPTSLRLVLHALESRLARSQIGEMLL